jgi:hypothetical protein
MPPWSLGRSVLLLCLWLVFLPSCRSTNQLLKAGPAELSAFIEHPKEMVDPRKKLPFHRLWKSPDSEVWAKVDAKKNIYIAPVTVAHLRPIKKGLARGEVHMGSIDRREDEMAKLMQTSFAAAFKKAPKPRFQLVEKPDADSVTLELALVELNPTSAKGNAVLTGLNFVVGPLAQLAGGYFTKGNIAFEGKLRNSQTGELFMEVTDNEEDRMTLYSLRDFRSYGHASHAIEAWAKQFEEFTRRVSGKKIRESAFFTLNPF